MSTGSKMVYSWTALNVGLANFQPGQVLMLDIANSANGIAARLPVSADYTLATAKGPLGICIDKSKVDPTTGAVDQAQGIAFVDMGREWGVASGTIAIGDKVSVANTSGQVQTQARAAAGAQPMPILGTAETATTGAGQGVLIRLEIGGTW